MKRFFESCCVIAILLGMQIVVSLVVSSAVSPTVDNSIVVSPVPEEQVTVQVVGIASISIDDKRSSEIYIERTDTHEAYAAPSRFTVRKSYLDKLQSYSSPK